MVKRNRDIEVSVAGDRFVTTVRRNLRLKQVAMYRLIFVWAVLELGGRRPCQS